LFAIWVVFHVIVCAALILVVLLQSSKGEGLAGSAFGGNISGAVFGGRGAASFLSRATTVLAIVFMVNCGVLAYMSAGTRSISQGGEVVQESVVTQEAQQEVARQLEQQQNLLNDTTAIQQQVTPEETSGN
jgi:preprotein translocase subunit SecG